MFQHLRSQLGSTMIQVLLLMAVVGGGSMYYLQNSQTQEKAMKFASYRMKANQLSVEISQALTDAGACLNTLKQNANITDDMAGIFNSLNQPMYVIGTQLYGGIIDRIRLVDYTPASGQKQSNPLLRLTIKFHEKNARPDGSFGTYHKDYDIPMFLIAVDNVATLCMSDETGKIAENLMVACEAMGGDYVVDTGACINLTGDTGIYITEVASNLCNTGPNCPHPYANKYCEGKDIRGVDHGNWVLTNFKADGTFACKCMKRSCPDPALLCQGQDNGTDWCDEECPKGTKVPQDWVGDTSTTCPTSLVTQTNSCGQTRQVAGTMDCSVATTTTTTTTTTSTGTSTVSGGSLKEGMQDVQSK